MNLNGNTTALHSQFSIHNLQSAKRLHLPYSVAVLVFFTAAARAWVVTANLLFGYSRLRFRRCGFSICRPQVHRRGGWFAVPHLLALRWLPAFRHPGHRPQVCISSGMRQCFYSSLTSMLRNSSNDSNLYISKGSFCS